MDFFEVSDWYSECSQDMWRLIAQGAEEYGLTDVAMTFSKFYEEKKFSADDYAMLSSVSLKYLRKFAELRVSGYIFTSEYFRGGQAQQSQDGEAKFREIYGEHPLEDRVVAQLYWATDITGRVNEFFECNYLDGSVHDVDAARLYWGVHHCRGIWIPYPDFYRPIREYYISATNVIKPPAEWELLLHPVDGNKMVYKVPAGMPVLDKYLDPSAWTHKGRSQRSPAYCMLLHYPCCYGELETAKAYRLEKMKLGDDE